MSAQIIALTAGAENFEALRSYLASSNHGRGRITGVTRRLLAAGLLRITWTSQVSWVLTITDAGRAAIAKAEGQS